MAASPQHHVEPDAGVPTPEGGGFHLEPRVARAFLTFSSGFWTGPTKIRAWQLTLGLAASLILSTYVTVQLNHWNRWFFDALERKDVATVKEAVLVFFLIIAAMAAIGVCIVLTRETLQVRWRAWLVEALVARWLDGQRFYRLNATGREPPNPEYRISDDTRWATEILVDLGIGLLSATIGGIAFISILWTVGGAITLGGITIPGYMVWVALAYGIIASALMAWVGSPLVGRVGQKNEAEGYFRFAMMRLRDNAESIAMMRGGGGERAILSRFYDTVVRRWLAIVRSHGHVTWITNSSGPMIPIVPLLFAAPKYLAGELTLGQVTQLAAAFIQVQIAISWVVDNYNRIAEWYASARRVIDIVDACDEVTAGTGAGALVPSGAVMRSGGPAATLRSTELDLVDPDGRLVTRIQALSLKAGDRLLITGDSGTGKTTLARVIAGLAQPGKGDIEAGASSLMLLPQKGYLPLGTLRSVIEYPRSEGTPAPPPGAVAEALEAAGLGYLIPRLDEAARWDLVLASIERQRVGVARVILHRPDVLVIDDALATLDEQAQRDVFALLSKALPDSIIVTMAQRSALARLHTHTWRLERADAVGTTNPATVTPAEAV